jgi:RNA polymerase sigma-70 factor, ECF subfamily
MAPTRSTTAVGHAAVGHASAEVRLQALYDVHARPLYWYLLQLTFGDRQAAEDLLQETMLRAWQRIDGLNPDIGTLRPWLCTVARRIAIDAGRARQARPPEVGAVDLTLIPASGDTIDQMLSGETIRRALMRLSPEHRNVIIEIYFRGSSTSEVALAFGIPEGTVKSRAYNALRALRNAIGSMTALG